jgi:hypothetical protein
MGQALCWAGLKCEGGCPGPPLRGSDSGGHYHRLPLTPWPHTGQTVVWSPGLLLLPLTMTADQKLDHLSVSQVGRGGPLCFSYFSDPVSHFLPRSTLGRDPLDHLLSSWDDRLKSLHLALVQLYLFIFLLCWGWSLMLTRQVPNHLATSSTSWSLLPSESHLSS